MAGLASLKNNIDTFLTPDDQPNEVLIFSMTRQNLEKTKKSLENYINALKTDNSPYTNEDRTMYLDKLYKIQNAFENRMRTIMNADAPVAYGGIRYKRRSKRRSSRRNKRTKRNKRFSRRR
jgi:hypothetical protein